MNKSVNMQKAIRVAFLILLDCAMVCLAGMLSLLILMEFDVAELRASAFLPTLLQWLPPFAIATVALFFAFKLYNSLWEYASVEELLHILVAIFSLNAVLFLTILFHAVRLPLSFPVLNALLLSLLTMITRFSYRMVRSVLHREKRHGVPQRRTMLIGAGNAGVQVLREFQTSVNSLNHVVCIIDDDESKHGQYMRNVKVVGNRNDILRSAEQYHIEEIVFAIPAAPTKVRKEILNICNETGCRLKMLPGLTQLANGEVTIQKIRDVDVLDLLGRDSVQVDLTQIAGYLQGKTVLVTGGGGSIGSELCRQIATHAPSRLIIFDIYENNAYEIQQELRRAHPELELITLIGSVRDTMRVDMVFRQYHPEIVFHAAAHKHVPLMEDSPNEAIKNNVFGTYHVVKAADRYQAETFVLISTDKAVNPTNIMGASKRICEMIVQMMSRCSKTKFVAVRFGNVLGSNGSVIPLFKQQIAEGGPVTVTHPDIIRYFMTIPEAVALVLQAGAYANQGEIFVLDMGEPVRIDTLARNLIRLSGFEPDVDIEVKYTGLRPGEKLFEEMLMDEEGLRSTENHLIYIAKPLEMNDAVFEEQLKQLDKVSAKNAKEIYDVVGKVVSTYHRLVGTHN